MLEVIKLPSISTTTLQPQFQLTKSPPPSTIDQKNKQKSVKFPQVPHTPPSDDPKDRARH
jgi:hypothetical protein